MKVLIYDVETVPTEAYVWSAWKQNVAPSQVIEHGRVVCWAAKWRGDKQKDVMFGAEWTPGQDSTRFIRDLHSLMEEADAVITYNGNKFDDVVMNTAFAGLGLTPPPPRKSIDLYRVVVKNFRLFHNRMDSVAAWLGIKGKTDTGGFDLWVRVMNEDPAAQKLMEKYNRQDIKVLEDIYKRLLPWIPNHPTDVLGHECPSCGSHKLQRRGYYKTKVSEFQRFQCQDCGSWSRKRLADKGIIRPEIVAI